MYINGVKVKSVTLDGNPVKAIGDGVTTLWQYEDNANYFYFEDLSGSANSVTLTKTGSAEEWVSLEYSADKLAWTPVTIGTAMPLAANGKIYLRGNNAKLSDSVNGSKTTHSFSSSGNVRACGNAVSLLDKSCPSTKAITTWFAFANLFEGMTTLVSTDTTLFDAVTSPYTYTFNKTFEGCTNLTNTCAFAGITGASQECFGRTYYGCVSITTASNMLPNISSISGNLVFSSTFSGCTSLVTPPPFGSGISVSGASTFMAMFNGCSALTSSPDFSFVTSVGTQTFRETFAGCSSLATAPSLSISAVESGSNNSFRSMFYQCTSLTSAANITITASTATNYCFYQMFTGCTSLTTAIDLSSITTLGQHSLERMYRACSSLQSITVGFTEWGDESDSTSSNYQATHEWTYGCNYASGVFTKPSTLPETRNSSDNTTSAHYIPYSWTVASDEPKNKLVLTNVGNTAGTIEFKRRGASPTFVYYVDSGVPTEYNNESELTVQVPAGSKLTLDNYRNTVGANETNNPMISTSGSDFSLSGDIYYSGDYEFATLFTSSDSAIYRRIVDSGGLTIHSSSIGVLCYRGFLRRQPITRIPVIETPVSVASRGFDGMFEDCTELTSAILPNLDSASSVSCLAYMFYNCSNLEYVSIQNTVWSSQYNWLGGVKRSGTFACLPGLSINTNTSSGIPSGWTRVNSDGSPIITKVQNSIQINGYGDIYYTTDGSTPHTGSTQYVSPFAAVFGQTIKAVCVNGGVESPVTAFTVAASQLSHPSISRNGNYVRISQSNDSYKQPVIKYTTDGSTPDENSSTYTGDIAAVYNQTIKARCISAYDTDLYPDSSVSTHVVSASTLTAPVISRSENNVVITQSNDSYKQAAIKYTTDGSTPDASSATYSSAFAAVPGQTVKAVCVSGYDTALYPDSSVTEFTVVTQKIPAPKIKFDANGNCTIENTAPSYMGGTVRYTTDGSAPTSSSTAYTAQFTVQLNDTVKAAAFSDNALYTDSDVSSKTYEGAVIFDPLTINNTSNETGAFYVGKYGSPSSSNLEYSLDGGTTWSNYDMTNRPNVSVPAGTSIMLRGSNPTGFNKGTAYSNTWRLRFDKTFTVYGSLFSLRNTDPAVFSAIDTTLDGEFMALFQENRKLTDASGLETSVIVEAATWSMWSLFQYCTSLTGAPDFSSLETIGNSGINMMFEGCSALQVGTNLLNVTSVTGDSFRSLYYGCSSLTTAWSPSVNPWNNGACDMWISSGTPSTGTLYKRPGITPGGVRSGWTIIEV